jgi:hypothetical protein
MPLNDAWIVVLPEATAVAKPAELMEAAEGFEELQVTEVVISDVDKSLKVPVAAY